MADGPGVFGPAPTDLTLDVDKEALADIQPLVDSMSTNLTTFSGHGGKLIFYTATAIRGSSRSALSLTKRIWPLRTEASKQYQSGVSFILFPG